MKKMISNFDQCINVLDWVNKHTLSLLLQELFGCAGVIVDLGHDEVAVVVKGGVV